MAKNTNSLELVKARIESAAQDFAERNDEYLRNYRQMLGLDVGVTKPWGAKVNSQHTHAQVMTWTAFIQAGLIPTYPWVFAEMNEPWRELEPRATEEYNARLRAAGFYRQLYLWLRQAAAMKLGVMKLGFGDTGPQMHLVHPGNLMWEQGAENLRHDAEWVIEVNRRQSKAMLKAQFDAGTLTCTREELDKVLTASADEQVAQEKLHAERAGSPQGEPEDMDQYVLTHEMVTPEKRILTHQGEDVVLREIDNPYGYVNYYDLVAYPEAHEVEGYGIPDLLRDLQDEMNTLRRQRIDIRGLIANPMWTILKSAGLDPFSIISAPGAVFPVNEHGALEPVQVQDNTPALQSEESILQADADRLVGVHGQTRGEPGRSNMKATVANLIHSNTNVRFAVEINMILDYPLRAFFADYVALSTMIETPIAITQPEWELVKEVADASALTLVPHSESYIGNAAEKFQLEANLFQMLAPITQPPGLAEIAKDMLNLIQIRDPERISRWIVGNMAPDPVDAAGGAPGAQAQAGQAPMTPGLLQPDQGAGRGTAMTEELARAQAPTQGGRPMAGRMPA